jgi:hypothetical protein
MCSIIFIQLLGVYIIPLKVTILSYFPYFEIINVGFGDHNIVCVFVNISPRNY